MIKKIFAWILASICLLSSFKSPVPGLDLGTFAVIIVLLYFVIIKNSKNIKPEHVLFVLYVLLTTVFNVLAINYSPDSYPSTALVFMRLFKFILVFSTVLVLGFSDHVDKSELIKAIRIVVYVNSVLVLVQQLLYVFLGYILRNPLAFLSVNDVYNSASYTMITTSIFRPSAFFLEPAHLSQYFILFLCYVLFCEKKNYIGGKRALDFFVTAMGIALTGSGMGAIMMIAVIVLALLFNRNLPLIRRWIFAIGFVVALCCLSRVDFVRTVFDRLFTSNVNFGGNAVEARVGSGYDTFLELPFYSKLFGCGFGNIPINKYFNGTAYMLNTVGILGILFFGVVTFVEFRRTNWFMRIALLCFVILLFGAQMFSAIPIAYYYGVAKVFSSKKEEREELKEYGR